ncbi:recombinase family protein [Sphingomonas kyungheensis]|uniref:recombinase family protein n=1 Tax=Sphingomonas kyungheensis TaxID=1069987 RepID=UPI00356B75E4
MFIRAYLRASTSEQDASRAREALDAFAAERGLQNAVRYVENESGATARAGRSGAATTRYIRSARHSSRRSGPARMQAPTGASRAVPSKPRLSRCPRGSHAEPSRRRPAPRPSGLS